VSGPGRGAAPATSAEAIALIEAASGPGELFGADAACRYRRLARLTHPDTCPGDERAARAFAKLASFWRDHQTGPLVARGDIANLYRVSQGLLKLVRDPADNDLMRREAEALTQLRGQADARFRAYFPSLVQARRQEEIRSGIQRHANLIGPLTGFRSLAEVRSAFPAGVDPRDAAWMWRRLLVAAGAAHRAGVIHGAVLPEHVMIHPAEHGLVVKPTEVREVIGDGLQAGLPFDALVAEVTAKWDTYYILPAGASYAGDAQVLGFWRDRLGQNVIELADLDAVCETIALTVGLGEDAISLDDGLADLGDVGSPAGPAVSRALAVIGAGRAALEVAAAPDDLDGPSGNVRL